MKQNIGVPAIIGAVVLLLVVIGVLAKMFLGGGDTVNQSVGGPPAYAKQPQGERSYTPNIPQGNGQRR